MSPALLPRLLLVFALLFAQLGGLTHAISHSMDERSRDATLTHEQHCGLCELYAQVSGAVGATALTTPVLAIPHDYHSTQAISTDSAFLAAYTARAPPYSV